jgi:hypothetical protein
MHTLVCLLQGAIHEGQFRRILPGFDRSAYFLYDGSGSGPSLKYAGTDYVAGEFGAWAPIGAEQTASGYEIAWKVTGADAYTVWSTDSNGNYLSNVIGAVSGSSYAPESLEPSFHQDLNGDGLVGPPTIGAGETLRVTSAYLGQVSFTASTGILELLNSSSFTGTVAGMTGQGTIDFADIDPTKCNRRAMPVMHRAARST